MIAAGRRGSIVNISSGASRQMRNGSVPYCTSKTALERLTKGLRIGARALWDTRQRGGARLRAGKRGEPAAG